MLGSSHPVRHPARCAVQAAKHSPGRGRRRGTLIAVVASVLALTAACSSSSSGSKADSGSGSGTSSGTSTSGTSGDTTQAALTTAHTGLIGKLPTTSVTPTKNVSIWVVSCGQAVTTCSTTSAGAVAAATAAGWKVHLCDGQLNPGGWSACIRQAVAAKPNAIDLIAIDCPPVRQALVEANKAGIKTINGGGFDCSELGGPQVYSGSVQYQPGLTNHEWWATLGKLQADWVIGATGGKAKVLSLKFTDEAWGADIQNAFTKELATCSGCSVVKTLNIGNADVVGGTLRTKFSTALLQSPTANAINVPIDGWFSAGLAQAVTSSGRAAKLKVIGSIGEAPNMGYIRSNAGENASAAFSSTQSGWAGIDVAIRVLAGQKGDKGFFPEGLSIQVVDKDANLPAAGQGYAPKIDYKSTYRKLWGSA